MDKNNIDIAIIMGSNSDWPTMKAAADILDEFNIRYESRVVSAHRTPDMMFEFAKDAKQNGYKIIIAGAGGAAHLPGMVAAKTTLPVLGVPISTKNMQGLDSLLSIVQMPKGVPVATFAVGEAGAANAALFAISNLCVNDPVLKHKLVEYRKNMEVKVMQMTLK
jgi:5-(carboxyamino)imidazole ribonucleotide mutase